MSGVRMRPGRRLATRALVAPSRPRPTTISMNPPHAEISATIPSVSTGDSVPAW